MSVPNDIQQIARMCTTDEEIARAIYSERKRCAALARRSGSPEWSEDTSSGYELAAREIYEGILGV